MKLVFDKKRFFAGLLFGIISCLICAIFFSAKAGYVFCGFFTITGAIKIESKNKVVEFLAMCAAAVIIAVCSQLIVDAKQIWLIKRNGLIAELSLILAIILLFKFITLNSKKSIVLCMVIVFTLSVIDRYLIKFRGSELAPLDFASVITANNVFQSYQLDIYAGLVYGITLSLIYLFAYPSFKCEEDNKARLFTILFLLISIFTGFHFTRSIHIETWAAVGSSYNGFITNFTAQLIDTLRDKRPEGYNMQTVSYLESKHSCTVKTISSKPDIIVIMDESFADLRVIGGTLNTIEDVMPFYDSLNDNTIKGYALSSVFGGGTANSEYEFLTGNTMAFLTEGATVYQLYLNRETYSLAHYLNRHGYYTFATHPYLSTGWARTKAYPLLGFDAISFVDDYPQNNMIRNFVSDQEMFEYITTRYEDWHLEHDDPLFMFGVSMQNHGSYEYDGDGVIPSLSLVGYSKDYPDAEQYLGLIHETDKALEYLINYFNNSDHEVVICFFGDHLPNLNQQFYSELHGEQFDNLDDQELIYTVPFFIWANYDIEETSVELTSLNYLSTYVLEAAGISLSAYNDFLMNTESTIPAINSKGYYSMSSDTFIPISDAIGHEKEALREYQIVQYNSLFEKIDKRSNCFFTVNE